MIINYIKMLKIFSLILMLCILILPQKVCAHDVENGELTKLTKSVNVDFSNQYIEEILPKLKRIIDIFLIKSPKSSKMIFLHGVQQASIGYDNLRIKLGKSKEKNNKVHELNMKLQDSIYRLKTLIVKLSDAFTYDPKAIEQLNNAIKGMKRDSSFNDKPFIERVSIAKTNDRNTYNLKIEGKNLLSKLNKSILYINNKDNGIEPTKETDEVLCYNIHSAHFGVKEGKNITIHKAILEICYDLFLSCRKYQYSIIIFELPQKIASLELIKQVEITTTKPPYEESKIVEASSVKGSPTNEVKCIEINRKQKGELVRIESIQVQRFNREDLKGILPVKRGGHCSHPNEACKDFSACTANTNVPDNWPGDNSCNVEKFRNSHRVCLHVKAEPLRKDALAIIGRILKVVQVKKIIETRSDVDDSTNWLYDEEIKPLRLSKDNPEEKYKGWRVIATFFDNKKKNVQR
jgi:hypothetical protein